MILQYKTKEGCIYNMKYRQYKKMYGDCQTVRGTYDKNLKTVDVIIPEGRMKESGVRGRKFLYILLNVGEDSEHTFEHWFKAVDYDHALARARREYAYVEE